MKTRFWGILQRAAGPLSLVCLGSTVGCSASGSESEPGVDSDQAAVMVGTENMAQLEIDGTKVDFERLTDPDGSTYYTLVETRTGPGFPPLARVPELETLTYLEVYRALAPEATAPEALLQSHPEQASLLGRQDRDTVKAVVLAPAEPIDKASLSWCESFIFTNPSIYWYKSKHISGTLTGEQSMDTGNSSDNVTLGVCNRSSSHSMETNRSWVTSMQSVPREDGWTTLSANSARRWLNFRIQDPEGSRSRYWVHGDSDYDFNLMWSWTALSFRVR